MICIDRVTDYATKVLNGNIITGNKVKLACKRHIDDLERSKFDDFDYIFNVDLATHIIDYAEELILNEGDEILPLELYPFQDFILGSLMGWVHKETGYRRFRSSYVQLARQQGKSMINGVLASYIANFDGYKNGKIGCVATNLKQSEIVWNEVVKFITADSELEEMFKITESDKVIKSKITGSKIIAMSKNWKSLDGFRYILSIIDELHAHPTNQFYKLCEGGQRKLKQALNSAITTAGENLNSFCKEHYNFCVQVLEGIVIKETQFIYIAEMDKDDDIWDYHNWIKSSPLSLTDKYGNFDKYAVNIMKDLAIEAKTKGGGDLVDFKTKALNIWVEFTDKKYINLGSLKKCESDLTLEDMRGKTCILSLDLSSGGDLTTLGMLFELENGKRFIESHSFIPEFKVLEHEKSDLAPYRQWINDKLLTTTPGTKTDYKFIIAYIKELTEKYNIKIGNLGYDPHNADTFLSDLEFVGVTPIVCPTSAKGLNDCTEDFRLSVDENSVLYNRKNKLLTWSIANALITRNSFGEIKVDKNYAQSCKRIDPVDAIIYGWYVYLKEGLAEPVDWDSIIEDEDWDC